MTTTPKLSITRKLGTGFIAILVTFVITTAIVAYQTAKLARDHALADRATQAMYLSSELRVDIETSRSYARQFLLTGSDQLRVRASQSLAAYDEHGRALRRLLGDAAPTLVGHISVQLTQIDRALRVGIVSELELGAHASTRDRAVTLVSSPASDQHRKAIDSAIVMISSALTAWSDRLDRQTERDTDGVEIVIAIGAAMTIVATALIAGYVMLAICRPLRAVARALIALADGKLDTPLLLSAQQDEIGQLSRALRHFQEAAIDRLRLEQEAQAARESADRLRESQRASMEALSVDQCEVLQALAVAFERVAARDLTTAIEVPFPAAYETLRHAMNSTVGQLHDAMLEVRQSSVALERDCTALHIDAETLAARSDAQAREVQSSVEAISEITQLVQQTAGAVHSVRILAGQAQDDALRSNAVIQRANATMVSINDFIGQIGSIARTINGISVQTDLLALNARVAAARSDRDDSGSGVIAVEIRALANQAGASAAEINAIVASSDTVMRDGRALADDVSATLEAICAKVGALNSQSERIASAAAEQAAGLVQINQAVEGLDSLARGNRKLAERGQSSALALAKEGHRLTRLVGDFRLRPEGDSGRSA